MNQMLKYCNAGHIKTHFLAETASWLTTAADFFDPDVDLADFLPVRCDNVELSTSSSDDSPRELLLPRLYLSMSSFGLNVFSPPCALEIARAECNLLVSEVRFLSANKCSQKFLVNSTNKN